jgi:GTP cyclohydrolase I
MNAPEVLPLPDTQSLPDTRRLAIQRVGVKGVRYPATIRARDRSTQPVLATFAMYVGLPHDVKGTHMSRFVEVLEAARDPLDLDGFRTLFDRMLHRLDAGTGELEMRFTWFRRKRAPVSGVESLLDYDVAWRAERRGASARTTLTVTAPVTSLCPCSKSISDYGAHNQRSLITLEVEVETGEVGIDELARIAEDEASCEIWGLLKRPDEKWVTERAYDNPKFVEDLVRGIALALANDPRIGRFRVASENFESIHNHSAYAEIEGTGAARPS